MTGGVALDGITWTKYAGNPVMEVGATTSWENAFLEGPSVANEGDTLRMWYTGMDTELPSYPAPYYWDIGYAYSLTGSPVNNPLPLRCVQPRQPPQGWSAGMTLTGRALARSPVAGVRLETDGTRTRTRVRLP